MKPIQILSQVAIAVLGLLVSIEAIASQRCVSACEGDVASIPDIKQRQDEFRLCYKLCSMEERNLSESSDRGDSGPESRKDRESIDEKKSDNLPTDSAKSSDTGQSNEAEKKNADTPSSVSDEKPRCSENFDAEVSACENATLKAQSSCDESGSLNDNLSNLASTAAIMGGQKSSMGIKESCSKMATYMKTANVALMAYRQLCNGAISKCISACSAPLNPRCNNGASSARVAGEARAAMSGNRSSCQAFSSKMTEVNAAVENYALIQTNAKSCAILNSGGNTFQEICQNDPTYPGCKNEEKMDCNDPAIATNKVCICSKNPTDPICGAIQEVSDKIIPTSSKNRKISKDLNPEDFSSATSSIDIRKPNGSDQIGSHSDFPHASKSGSSTFLNSPPLAAGLRKRLKEKKIMDSPVLSGFYQGSQQNAEKKYEKLNIEGNNQASLSREKQAHSSESKSSELEKYLPKAYDPRVPIGLLGLKDKIGTDGITGPHSSIWEKISNRYQSIMPTLLP